VGSRSRLIQAGCVGGGVGMMMVGMVGTTLGVTDAAAEEQELRKKNMIKLKTKISFCIDLSIPADLLNCGL
jgi:hypothetical protein